jgi:hypothetical protein
MACGWGPHSLGYSRSDRRPAPPDPNRPHPHGIRYVVSSIVTVDPDGEFRTSVRGQSPLRLRDTRGWCRSSPRWSATNSLPTGIRREREPSFVIPCGGCHLRQRPVEWSEFLQLRGAALFDDLVPSRDPRGEPLPLLQTPLRCPVVLLRLRRRMSRSSTPTTGSGSAWTLKRHGSRPTSLQQEGWTFVAFHHPRSRRMTALGWGLELRVAWVPVSNATRSCRVHGTYHGS